MSKLRDAAQQALEALEKEPADYADWIRTMKAARAALRTALAEQPEQETGNWIVYNSGAEVASGLLLAEALEYLTPERLARQWCAVCVVDQSNLPKTPQPAKPAEQEPVAWCDQYEGHIDGLRHYSDGGARETPLYTAPQPRKQPLTREELFELAEPFGEFQYGDAQGHKRIDFANAIIAAYERKNGVQT